ncbi:nitrogen assimilation transcription factor nit-4 [Colletotrichum orchidophilum]|uniref:Nitrogen assimilation transcription factor nit-4 n=1 Tax=Colletotrichum orchidophilum TaxID=1209926 RepID=A0A1G4BJZ6_9PEZI|nr:nitrogen assimilation transcription factor nit-4 [Colletotrichum orchidophilum]OHF01744.1 nitrogen assimilation transcription factor nit-4 [Colletotrichum orchidophilum]
MSTSFSLPQRQPEGKKRQRVSIACLACRQRRMRCDGQQPICGSCTRRGTECEFQHAENKRRYVVNQTFPFPFLSSPLQPFPTHLSTPHEPRTCVVIPRPPSKKYVESLQARIKHLEAQVVALGSQPASGSGSLAAEITENNDQQPGSTGEDDDDDDDDDGDGQGGPLSDLTGLVGRLNVTDDGQLHYFGSQSSYNLVREPARDSTCDPREPSLKMQRQGLLAAAQLGKMVTVPDELQAHLLELYWRWQNPWNYVIHKSAFLRSYRGEDDGKYCSPLLLCSIFAIAARYSDRPELRTVPDDPSTAGDAFGEHAKILLLYESEAPTITTVQAACLLALRIMSDGKEALGWLYSGNATRMAHNLGLHLDCSKWGTAGLLSEEDAEARKVTWWGCYVVDKLFSTGLGRPSSTPKSTISCPKPSIDSNEEYTPWLPTSDALGSDKSLGVHSHISSTACHVSETFTIACESMDIIYAANSKLSTREIEDVVSKTDVELRTHYRQLPSYLRLPASPKTPMLPHVCLFHIQFHAHLILLHRPLVHKRKRRPVSVNTPTDDSSIEGVGYENQHMVTCRHSAAEIARLLRIYKQQYTLRRIPIAAVHLCFAAVVIHLIDAQPSSPNRQQAIRHLQTCVEALRDLRTAWCAWSDRALRAARLLAREWYQCEDVSLLQHWGGIGGVEGNRSGPAAAAKTAATLATPAAAGVAVGISTNQQQQNQHQQQQHGGGTTVADRVMCQRQTVDGDAKVDPLAFLFDVATPDQYTDSLVKEWLAESGYDVLNTVVE